MIRKFAILSVILLALSLTLAACSGSQVTQASQPTQSAPGTGVSGAAQGTPNPSQVAPGGNSTGEQLAVGTLKLEGTDQAVTADEAKQLLPLWQQVKTLSGDTNATTDQIQAVYDQISSGMTTGQVQAIQAMTFNQADLQALMIQLGIQVTPGMGIVPGGQGTPNAPQGTLPAGTPGGRQPGNSGTPGLQGTPGPQGTPGFQGTPGAGMPGGRNGGMNNLFIDVLIQLLTQRAG